MTELSAQDKLDVETLWNFHVVDTGASKADFIIVLGSHDLRVADYAAEEYQRGAAPQVIVSGGAGKVTQHEWKRSEADIYSERMISLGVPKSRIILEEASTNTGDNFAFSKKLSEKYQLALKAGIIVCKPYMARRAYATAGKRWPEVEWCTRPPVVDLWDYPSPDTPLDRMINLMVGDLQRLDIYAVKGFQIPVEISNDAWEAYHRLVARGYDRFVIDESSHRD